jgi:hypothetical protein
MTSAPLAQSVEGGPKVEFDAALSLPKRLNGQEKENSAGAHSGLSLKRGLVVSFVSRRGTECFA